MIAEAALVFIAVVVLANLVSLIKRKLSSLHLPPGPQPYPLVGNLPHLVGPLMPLAMTELAKKYGKIYSLTLPGQQCVVLNSSELAREALLTRKDEFSGRPSTFVGDFITRSSADIICADHTQTMVRLRKIAHKALQMYGRGMQRLEGRICQEADHLAHRFAAHNGAPIDPKDDVAVTVLNVICSLVYGQR
ncbi:predicted protein, partial [Nematostella vectensis]